MKIKNIDIFKNLIINPSTKNNAEIYIFLSNEIITNNILPEYRNKIYVDLKSSKKNKSFIISKLSIVNIY